MAACEPWKSGTSTSTPQSGNALANGADGQREQLGAAVLAVVAIDAGDDGELQPQGCARLRPRGAARRNRPASGAPFCTAQNPQRRVQTLPRIMNVAVRRFQHSPTLGQAALSQTV